jgi:hypothetical protein
MKNGEIVLEQPAAALRANRDQLESAYLTVLDTGTAGPPARLR